jgi:pimeloyl-ACP methyl ester carboxylesterase
MQKTTLLRSPFSLYTRPRFKIANSLSTVASRSFATSPLSDDQSFSLPDGRVLGFAEYGSPKGYPLMFLHGFPSSRLEAKGVTKIAQRHNLRIISPDRPGFGLSTFQLNRRIIDWPADVRALARHLQLSRFSLLGGSGGGPYALACAHYLPSEMLSSVGVLAGAPPWQAGTQDLLWMARLTHWVAEQSPTGLRIMTNGLTRTLRWGLGTKPMTRYIENWLLKNGSDSDTKIPVEERRQELIRIVFEGFAQGADGFVQETQLLTGDWGFKFEDINYDKIHVWHGTKDVNAPISMIRYMVDRLPHVELREFDDTHFTIHRHLDEILTELIPQAQLSARTRS